jgi:hypothetical protein
MICNSTLFKSICEKDNPVASYIQFQTNLDCPKGYWIFPKQIYVLPQIGQYIQTNHYPLKVVSITTKLDGSIIIELNK